MTTTKNIIFWTGTTLATVFFGLLTFMSLYEWWTVKIKNQTDNYPWGPINENPWYYDTPKLYSSVMLTEGILFAIALTVLARQLLKKDKTKIFYTLLACFGLFIAMLVNGQIR
mgnify:FL=1